MLQHCPRPAPLRFVWPALVASALLFSPTVFAAEPPAAAATQTPGHAPAQAVPASGLALADVHFPAQLNLHDNTLQLNGAGIRHKLMFKVYAAGMYFSKQVHTQAEANAADGPKRIRLVPLRTINAEELSRLFLRSLEDNAEKTTFYRLAPSLLQISQVFTDIRKLQPGDELTMDWVPGQGTVVMHNGAVKSDTFKDREFFDALMSIWLGPKPADATLKQSLLGQAPPAVR